MLTIMPTVHMYTSADVAADVAQSNLDYVEAEALKGEDYVVAIIHEADEDRYIVVNIEEYEFGKFHYFTL